MRPCRKERDKHTKRLPLGNPARSVISELTGISQTALEVAGGEDSGEINSWQPYQYQHSMGFPLDYPLQSWTEQGPEADQHATNRALLEWMRWDGGKFSQQAVGLTTCLPVSHNYKDLYFLVETLRFMMDCHHVD